MGEFHGLKAGLNRMAVQPSLSVCCFSRNRPLQLDGYLRSLEYFFRGKCAVSVLFRSDPAYLSAYGEIGRAQKNVSFLPETDFCMQIRSLVRNSRAPFFMFGCDDVLFKGDWSLSFVSRAFEQHRDLLGFSLRLGREIRYSQPAARSQELPEFIKAAPYLLWKWRRARVDWGYPFEVDCTMYRTDVLRAFLDAMDEHGIEWNHPNRLEGAGLRVALALKDGYSHLAAYPEAKACCITLNRVQDLWPNAVYGDGEYSTEKLLALWGQGFRIDLQPYAGRTYDRVHIGDLHLTPTRAEKASRRRKMER